MLFSTMVESLIVSTINNKLEYGDQKPYLTPKIWTTQFIVANYHNDSSFSSSSSLFDGGNEVLLLLMSSRIDCVVVRGDGVW